MEGDYELAQISAAMKMPEERHDSHHGSIDRDAADLARLGKKPVLKVSSELLIPTTGVQSDKLLAAQIWVHVATGFQLYYSHHLGGHTDVKMDSAILLGPS